jgi:phosphatidylinositol glycan class M
MTLTRCLILAAILRVILLVYGAFQDRTPLKYTDIDYFVFTDAARFVADGKSPYLRETYRYTPLLAWILVPNIWLFHSWGKVLFSLCDLVGGWLVARFLAARGMDLEKATWRYASLILLNPFIATISTRGSAESVVNLLVIATFTLVLERKLVPAAVAFGLAVHFKIYPILYALPFLVVLDDDFWGVGKVRKTVEEYESDEPVKRLPRSPRTTKRNESAPNGDTDAEDKRVRRRKPLPISVEAPREASNSPKSWNPLNLINRHRVVFGLVSGATFIILNVVMFVMFVEVSNAPSRLDILIISLLQLRPTIPRRIPPLPRRTKRSPPQLLNLLLLHLSRL